MFGNMAGVQRVTHDQQVSKDAATIVLREYRQRGGNSAIEHQLDRFDNWCKPGPRNQRGTKQAFVLAETLIPLSAHPDVFQMDIIDMRPQPENNIVPLKVKNYPLFLVMIHSLPTALWHSPEGYET